MNFSNVATQDVTFLVYSDISTCNITIFNQQTNAKMCSDNKYLDKERFVSIILTKMIVPHFWQSDVYFLHDEMNEQLLPQLHH